MSKRKPFIVSINFGDAGIKELSFGTSALAWLEDEAEKRTGKASSFMREINAFSESLAKTGGNIGAIVRIVRAGFAHTDAVPSVRDVYELFDNLGGDDRVEGEADSLMSMFTKISAALGAGMPGVGNKKKPATVADANATKAAAEVGADGDPTVTPSTGTAS